MNKINPFLAENNKMEVATSGDHHPWSKADVADTEELRAIGAEDYNENNFGTVWSPPGSARTGSNRAESSCLGHPRLSIIATTSPEIEALNLSNRPSFPEGIYYSRRRSNSHDSTTSSLSGSPESSRSLKNSKTTPETLASQWTDDDTVHDPTITTTTTTATLHLPNPMFSILDDDEIDKLIPKFIKQTLEEPAPFKYKLPPFDFSNDNKENIPPNLLLGKSDSNNVSKKSRPSLVVNHHHHLRDPSTKNSRKKKTKKSTPRHRRGSFESLPSPAEIGQEPPLVRRQTSCCSGGSGTFFPTDSEVRPGPLATCRPRPSHYATSKSMQLTIGFR